MTTRTSTSAKGRSPEGTEGLHDAAGEELTESEERLRDFAAAATDWFWELDKNLRFTYHSTRILEISGSNPEDMLGKTWQEADRGYEDSEDWHRHLACLKARRAFRNFEYSCVILDGSSRHYSTSGIPIFDRAGHFEGYRGTGTDITERKQAEQPLRKAQSQLKHAARAAKLGHWRFDEVANQYLSISEEFARIFGLTVEEYLKRYPSLEQSMEPIHPEDQARVLKAYKMCGDVEVDYRIVRADGELRYVRETCEDILDEAGNVVEAVGTLQDITELKTVEQALRESEAQLETRVEERTIALTELNVALTKEIAERKRTERALRESEALHRQSARMARLGYWEWDDIEDRLLSCSEGYARIFEMSVDELLASECSTEGNLKKIHPEDRAGYAKAVRENDAHRKEYELEYRIITQSGAVRYVHDLIAPVFGEDGRRIRSIGTLQNITARREASEALRDSEERFRNLIEGSIQGIFINRDRIPVFANQPFADILGYHSPEELLVAGSYARHIAPHDNERMLAYRKARLSGQPAPDHYEFDAVRKDGTMVRLRNVVRVIDWHGQSAIQSTVIDITEYQQAEQSLREREAWIRSFMESAPSAITMKDLEGRFQVVNDRFCEWYGVSEQDCLGQPSAAVFSQFTTDYITDMDRKAIELGKPYQGEMEQVLSDGARHWLHVVKSPIVDGHGQLRGTVTITTDISERKRAEEAISDNAAMFERWKKSNFIGINQSTAAGDVIEANDTLLNLLGYSRQELLEGKMNWAKITPPEYLHLDAKALDEAAKNGFFSPFEKEYFHHDGTRVPVLIGGSRFREDPDEFIVFIVDLTERKRAEQTLSFQATHDALTGLINRSDFERRLTRVLETARTSHDEHALCYLDLDQFKVINDTCGHMAGDELLRQLSHVLSTSVRKRDTLARLGGDEFGVLMEHCTLAQARRVANKVRRAVEEFRFVWEEQAFRIGVSIGLVPITETSESVATLLSAADSACYAAKDEGRNRVRVYQPDDTELARRQGEMAWVARIDQALEDDRLQLWSQPIVPVVGATDEGEHFELLLRLIDERGKIVPPGAFLPAAERYGLSTKLDRWVVGAALDWLGRNPSLLVRLHLCCINLSGTSLADEEFLVVRARTVGAIPDTAAENLLRGDRNGGNRQPVASDGLHEGAQGARLPIRAG